MLPGNLSSLLSCGAEMASLNGPSVLCPSDEEDRDRCASVIFDRSCAVWKCVISSWKWSRSFNLDPSKPTLLLISLELCILRLNILDQCPLHQFLSAELNEEWGEGQSSTCYMNFIELQGLINSRN